jgi:periplasmic protein TonB
MVEVVVTEKGEVRDARVVKAPSKNFADNAVKAVKKWKFKPASKDGKPIMVKAMVEVVFRVFD